MDLYTENLSLFSPGTNGHDISMRPFFEKKQGGGLRIFAAGLGTSYYESESKAARNKLLFQVIKGGNVLNLRDVIDTYPACFPNGMVRLDKNLLTLFAGADKVLTKPLLSL